MPKLSTSIKSAICQDWRSLWGWFLHRDKRLNEKQIDPVVISSFTVWGLIFGLKNYSADQLACFFHIKYLHNGLLFWPQDFIFCQTVRYHDWNLLNKFCSLMDFWILFRCPLKSILSSSTPCFAPTFSLLCFSLYILSCRSEIR